MREVMKLKNKGLIVFLIIMLVSVAVTIYFGITDTVYNGFRVGLWSKPSYGIMLNPETDFREVFNPFSPNIWLLVIFTVFTAIILIMNLKGKIKNWKLINGLAVLWFIISFLVCIFSANGIIFSR